MDLPTIQIRRRRPLRERTPENVRSRSNSREIVRSRSNSREIIITGSRRPRCIDLTTAADEEFIDLTSPQALRGVNDSPVVVLDDSDTDGRQSLGRRIQNRQSRSNGTSNSPAEANDSIVILPDLDLSQDIDAASTSEPVTSPGLRKIVCPICLDDEKQIQRSGRQLASTVCGHVFCFDCIRSAVTSMHCCPTCRKKLNKAKVFPLYI